tara:strand:- start:47 stop:442 length:396 start_codon:yes stop_codon:yes gene_type:complete
MSNEKEKMSKEELFEEQKIRLKYFKKHMAEKEEGMSEEEKARERFLTDDFIDDYTKWYADEEGIDISDEPKVQPEKEELLTRAEWLQHSNRLAEGIRKVKESINYIYYILGFIVIILASPWAMGQLWDIKW